MNIDWRSIFAFETPWLELLMRGTAIYFGLIVILRVLAKRHLGALTVPDLLVIVLLADAAQNGMAGGYHSVSEGLFLCAVIVGWSRAIDQLAYRYEWVRRLIEAPPLTLIEHGRLLRSQLRRAYLTEDELLRQLREQGVEKIDQVKRARLESDGNISVIRAESTSSDATTGPPSTPGAPGG